MIQRLAIYGAGGFGREVALMVEQMNSDRTEWEVIGFFDDGKGVGTVVDGLRVLGGINELNHWATPLFVVVAVADPMIRRELVHRLENRLLDYPVMIHPRSLTGSGKNKFGKGTIITAGCILTTGIELGDFVIVNLSSTIGHDVKVNSFSSIMPGCNISGGVTIGEASLVGTGAQLLQQLSVGDECKIGAGAVVTKSVESGRTFIGVPARRKDHA